MAEVFILLIFLLLLAFLGLTRSQEEEVREQERQRLETVLSEWSPVIDEFRSPEKIRTLHRRAAKLLTRLQEEEVQEQERRRLETVLSEWGPVIDEFKSPEKIRTLHRRATELQQQIDSLSRQLNVRKKGENPPCWYKTVSAGAGKTREKPYYTFDIAIYDDFMVVRRREPPPGRAEDDNGQPYVDEARKLDLGRGVVYDTRLADAELREQMRRIHDLGKHSQVRTYPCIFWVRVWDKTSADAKARWKEAHDKVLEWLFGTYNVKDEPWPE